MASYLKDMDKTVTEIRSNIVCQICEGRARPKMKRWYRCLNLHQICSDCLANLHQVANDCRFLYCSCGEPISKEYCQQTEQILSIKGMTFNCLYEENGCQETFDGTDLKGHEFDCIYRTVPCPHSALDSNDCQDKVTFQNVIEHYEQEHLPEGFNDNQGLQTIEWINTVGHLSETGMSGVDTMSHPFKIVVSNRTFLLMQKTSQKIMYYWVYILGSLKEAKQFYYTLKLCGKNKIENEFRGKVAAIDETFGLIYRSGKCFAIPHEVFKTQYVNDEREHYFSLEIRNSSKKLVSVETQTEGNVSAEDLSTGKKRKLFTKAKFKH